MWVRVPVCPQASIQSATIHVEMEALEAVLGWQVLVARGTTKGRDWRSLPVCRGQTDLSQEGNPEVLKFLRECGSEFIARKETTSMC